VFNFLVRRSATSLLTLWFITFIVFALIRNMPGDPIKLMVAGSSESANVDQKVTNENIELMKKSFGLDQPWYLAYWSWVGGLVQGDLGRSITDRKLVTERIGERLGPTLNLSLISIGLMYLLSIPIGLYMTAKNGKWQEQLLSNFFYLLYSFPSYVMALYLILFLSVRLDLLPLGGMTSRGDEYDRMSAAGKAWDHFTHLILPVTCYTYGGLAYYTRFIRMNMLEVTRQDYVRTARAKGVSEPVVFYRHAFRNALIPLVTLLGLALPGLLGGSVILEKIFSWPGMGNLFFDAITQRDYPVIMGLTLTFAVLVQAGSLLSDILYAVVDPRISYS
jgi:peptide/nickel transport system permease protein